MTKGQLYYIDFSGYKGSEINNTHLGIIYPIPNIKNMVFCIPLTSPKEKHFKTQKDFQTRNYHNLKYHNLIYIDQNDSIALLEQMRAISINRLISTYRKLGNNLILNNKNLELLNNKAIEYFKRILNF